MKKRRRWLMPLLAAVTVLSAAAALKGPEIGGWILRQLYPRRFSETVGREARTFAKKDVALVRLRVEF